MDYQLNIKTIPSSSSSPSSSIKRSFRGKKLQYQEKIVEQSILTSPTTLSPTYLTVDNTWKKTVATIVSSKHGNGQKRQEMELKNVGKVGMIKRKQFLQKRDISRSHEVTQKKKNK